jgi:hypothetical protein
MRGTNTLTELASDRSIVRNLNDASYGFHQPESIVAAGRHLVVANVNGGVTELDARDGSLVRVMPAYKYAFSEPDGVAVAHGELWRVLPSSETMSGSRARATTPSKSSTPTPAH